MIVVTGATGQLGQRVVQQLLEIVPAAQVAVMVRGVAKAADLAARGVDVRVANYDEPATVYAALAGAKKVLLVSGSEIGKRALQHRAVISAATQRGVQQSGTPRTTRTRSTPRSRLERS